MWMSADGQYRNQTDYVIGSRKWRSLILSAKTISGADVVIPREFSIYKLDKILKQSQCQRGISITLL